MRGRMCNGCSDVVPVEELDRYGICPECNERDAEETDRRAEIAEERRNGEIF